MYPAVQLVGKYVICSAVPTASSKLVSGTAWPSNFTRHMEVMASLPSSSSTVLVDSSAVNMSHDNTVTGHKDITQIDACLT